MSTQKSRTASIKKIVFRLGIILLIGFVAGCSSLKISPWPSVLVMRYAFKKNAKETNQRLEKHVPKGISEILDIQYDLNDKDAKLDIYYPTDITEDLPIIVWIHGGGWVSGNKRQTSNYFKILSSHGYIVASIDYSIAPGAHYPTPVRQTMAALKFLQENAPKYQIATSKMFLAGDSGGAHIAAQVANIVTDPSYAEVMEIPASIEPSKLKGVILYCGPYIADKVNLEGKFGGFEETVLWAYSGKRNFLEDPYFQTASIINYVGKNYPPSFISAGNDDPLLSHSEGLAKKLKSLNVETDTLFFPADLTPKLPHEYQFNLDVEGGKIALKRSLEFLKNNQ